MAYGIKLPFTVTSSANARGHTKARAEGPRRQRALTTLVLQNQPKMENDESFLVIFHRVAPRLYDEKDNLPMAFKAVRDAVAKHLGVSDSAYHGDKIDWLYRQTVCHKSQPEEAWLDVRSISRTDLMAMRQLCATAEGIAIGASFSQLRAR